MSRRSMGFPFDMRQAPTSHAPPPHTRAHVAPGATAGNAVCLNNIISAQAVLALQAVPVSRFLSRTALPVAVFYVISTAVGVLFALL